MTNTFPTAGVGQAQTRRVRFARLAEPSSPIHLRICTFTTAGVGQAQTRRVKFARLAEPSSTIHPEAVDHYQTRIERWHRMSLNGIEEDAHLVVQNRRKGTTWWLKIEEGALPGGQKS